MKQKKKVLILFTKFSGKGAVFTSFITRSKYPHVSIGLEEDLNTFYSFVTPKGFLVEKITRYVKPDREPFAIELYELEVPEHVYENIKHELQLYVENKNKLHYSKFAVALAILRIPFRHDRHAYFCSHFVAEVLENTGTVELPIRPIHCFARHLKRLPGLKLHYQGNMKTMIEHFKLTPALK